MKSSVSVTVGMVLHLVYFGNCTNSPGFKSDTTLVYNPRLMYTDVCSGRGVTSPPEHTSVCIRRYIVSIRQWHCPNLRATFKTALRYKEKKIIWKTKETLYRNTKNRNYYYSVGLRHASFNNLLTQIVLGYVNEVDTLLLNESLRNRETDSGQDHVGTQSETSNDFRDVLLEHYCRREITW